MKLIKKLLLKYYTNKLNEINSRIEFIEQPKFLFSKKIDDGEWNSLYGMFIVDKEKVENKIKKLEGEKWTKTL